LIYDSYFNKLSLSEEKTILPLKEFIIRKYFDEVAKIRTESEEANQSMTSLGFKYPEHAVVEVSDKITSLGFKNLSESTPNQRMDLENEIKNIINKEHSKFLATNIQSI